MPSSVDRIWFFGAAVLLASSVVGLCADDVTATYFEQLRRRGLYGLAEEYCLDRLSQTGVTGRQRVQFTIELSRTFVEHAKLTAGEEQEDLWRRAAAVVDRWLDQHPGDPQRLVLQVQRAMVPAAKAEFLRWQTELFPYDRKLERQALAAFGAALATLKSLEKTLDETLSQLVRRRGDAPPLPPHEIRRLLYNVRFQLAATLLGRARLSDAGDPDRAAALIDSEERLRQMAGGVQGDRMTWLSQLLLAEATRLRGDPEQAARMLDAIEKEQPPADLFDRLTATRVRVFLDRQRPDQAADLLLQYRKARRTLSGELRFLKVKSLVALWQLAIDKNDTATADKLFEQIDSTVARAELDVAGFWSERCRLLRQRAVTSRQYGAELAVLVESARGLYADGQIEPAAREFQKAAALAHRRNKPELAFEMGYTQASIRLQAGQYGQAAEAFQELTETYPQDKRTPQADLLRAYCLGKQYEADPTAERLGAYVQALQGHRRRFADDTSVSDADWMLGNVHEQQGRPADALRLYLQIPAEHDRGPAAQVAAARCYEAILRQLRASGQDPAEWIRDADQRLQPFVSAFPPAPEPLDAPQAELAMRFARLLLNRARPNFRQADRLLDRVLSSVPETTDENAEADSPWRALEKTSMQLRIVSLAGQQRYDEARNLIGHLSGTNAADVLRVLDGLIRVADYADKTTRRSLGTLQLQTAESLDRRRQSLTASQRRRLDFCLAEACLATNQPRRAIGIYQNLLAQSPRDKQLIKTIAALQSERSTPAFQKQARTNWRKLEALEKPGTPAWFEARYQVLRCSLKLGERDECRKLLGVTRLLYPDLGGGEWKTKFARLQDELKK